MSLSSGLGTSSGGLKIGGDFSESSFLVALLGLGEVPQISRNSTDFCPMRAGISQMKRKHPTPIFGG